MADIEEILPRRSDLSTFLAHLTRSSSGSAKDILCKILIVGRLSPLWASCGLLILCAWNSELLPLAINTASTGGLIELFILHFEM